MKVNISGLGHESLICRKPESYTTQTLDLIQGVVPLLLRVEAMKLMDVTRLAPFGPTASRIYLDTTRWLGQPSCPSPDAPMTSDDGQVSYPNRLPTSWQSASQAPGNQLAVGCLGTNQGLCQHWAGKPGSYRDWLCGQVPHRKLICTVDKAGLNSPGFNPAICRD